MNISTRFSFVNKLVFFTSLLIVFSVQNSFSQSITANNDDFSSSPFNPVTGGTTVSVFFDNGFTEDLADGVAATDANIDDNISISNDGGLTGVTINSDGTIIIPSDSTPGSYTVEYSICLDVNNAICGLANVSIVIGNCLDFPSNDCDGDGVINSLDVCEGFDDNHDTDGDNVPDGCDLDDDNDGLLDAEECNASNALINGNFDSNLVTGWTESGDDDWFRSGISGGIARFTADNSDSTFEQTVTVYEDVITAFTFQDAADASSTVDATLEISIDGTVVYSKTAAQIQADNGGANVFASQSLFFVSNTDTAVVSVRAFSSGPGVSDDFRLDNMFVELCLDTDGGGTPNIIDSDSDNDGCPDALEGDGGYTLADLDEEDSLGDSVDANGVPLVGGLPGQQNDFSFNSTNTNAISVECDNDRDGVSNMNDQCPGFDDTQNADGDLYVDGCDDDDDNDGILDVVEKGYTSNSQPICGGQTALDFSNVPIEEVGDGSLGTVEEDEVFRFTNVAPGIDAIVTVNEVFNCFVTVIDENSTDPTFFKPEIRLGNVPAGQQPFVEYEFQFVQSGTTIPFVIPELFINFNDLDGNDDLSEQNWTEYPISYTVDNPSEITIADVNPWIVGTSSNVNSTGTSNANPLFNFSARYLNTSSQTIRLGLLTNVPDIPLTRRHSVEFNCVSNFNDPITYLFDIDHDGIPNHLDPDSDNDGCYDVVESGGVDGNNDEILDGSGIDSDGLITGGVGGYDGVNGTEIISDLVSNITITPDPATICESEDLVLTAAPTGVRVTDFGLTGSTSDDTTIAIPTADYIYQWYLGATALTDGIQYSGTQTAILTINDIPVSFDTNTYRVEVSTVNNRCPQEESISITVNAGSATVSSTDASVCSGEDGEFVITGDAGDSVTYSIDGGASVTAVIPADGTLEIAVIGITSNTSIDVSNVANTNCDTDLTGVSATITINAAPTAATVSSTDASVCSGEDGEFVITGDAGDSVTYSIDGGASVTAVIPADGTLEIAVIGITSNTSIDVSNVANTNCDTDLTGVSATITINAAPTAATVSSTDASVCSGEDGEFVITGDAGDSVTYSIDGGSSVTAVIPADGTLEIAVIGITSNTSIDVSNVANTNCDADLTGVSATITVGTLPNAGSNGNVEICTNEDLTEVEILAELGGTPDSGGVWTDNMSNVVSFPITEAGMYTYTVIGNAPCDSVTVTASVTVTECPLPLIEVIKTASVNDNGDNVVGIGDVINYTITVENIGNLILENVIIVSDVLTDLNGNSLIFDSPLTFFGPTSSMGSIEGNLLLGERATYLASYIITQSDVDAGGVSNIAVASGDSLGGMTVSDQSDDPSDLADNDLDGNGDPDDPTIIDTDSDFELTVLKEVDTLEPLIGDDVTFTITVSNEGFVTATGVVVEDILPSGYTFVNAIATAPTTYSGVSGEWTVGQLNPGQVEILQITVEVLGYGDYLNTALISDYVGGTDINLNNNESSASVDPLCLTIYNEFSPNGDGVNDTFVIDCIETFSNNKLEVYNRWGNIVYSKKGYRNDWSGISNGRIVIDGSNQLPDGTYYYVIDLGDGSEPRVGWLYINR